jgi:hypothetical protein
LERFFRAIKQPDSECIYKDDFVPFIQVNLSSLYLFLIFLLQYVYMDSCFFCLNKVHIVSYHCTIVIEVNIIIFVQELLHFHPGLDFLDNHEEFQRKYALTPSSLTPSTLTPSTLTPSTLTPSSLTPSTLTPSSLTPSTLTPSSLTPSTLTPSTLTPSSLTPRT